MHNNLIGPCRTQDPVFRFVYGCFAVKLVGLDDEGRELPRNYYATLFRPSAIIN